MTIQHSNSQYLLQRCSACEPLLELRTDVRTLLPHSLQQLLCPVANLQLRERLLLCPP